MANQVDFKILPSDQFNVYSPQTRSDKIITYFTLLSKLRGDILAVGQDDDPNDIVSAYYSSVGGTQTLHLVKADGSEITASQSEQVISGTLNYVSKFTSANDIGDSQIFDDGTNVGIGTTTMTHKLQLGTGGVFADYFQLDTTYSNGFVIGAISWDQDAGTADVGLSGSLKLKIGQDDVWYVKNQTGSPITKGTPVYANGTLGASGRITIAPMIADGTILARFFLGIVAETIANGADGYVLAKGKLRQVNTNAYNEGDVLWVSPTTAGTLTNVEPTAPNLKLPVAFVVYKASNGILAVRATTGQRIEDASDVNYAGAVDNSFLVYDLATGVWVDEAVGIFKTIAVSGQSDVVADTYTDTLTLVAGTNVTITTNAGTDTITINSTDQFVGTVTSVDMSVPTGFAISGNPITTSGTLALAFATGYSLPTDATQANWTAAYNDKINSASFDTSTGVITLTQQDAGTVTVDIDGRFILLSEKGAANGVATLDAGGKLPVSQLPSSVFEYKGTWNAATNTPTLANGTGDSGDVYRCTVAGTVNFGAGAISFEIGDLVIYDGTEWQKSDSTDAVTSVNGYTGTVVLTTSDISEGTNLYFTTARARQSLSAGTAISYDNSTGVITNSAPDQIVAITAGTGTSVTGTYPNFTISATGTGGTVTSVDLTAGTGISVSGGPITTSGSITVTNTAPDQIVSLTGAGTTSVSGTYPNFTITSNDQYVGTVTSIATTAPITGGTITTTGTIGITQSGTASDGYLSSTDWNTFNSKEPALAKGNLTETTSSVLTITGGTNAVIGSGTTIAVSQSSSTTSGYLSSTDWNTFNGKAGTSFTTISVSGQSNIVADSASDTLTIVSGTGVSITTDASTDTLTITNSAPDQVVSITGAGTTSVTGTYPSFTITSNDQYDGTVTSVDLTAGTGISVSGGPITTSGSITVTNTAPDQIVSLTGAGTTTITGTYPNFTISSDDQYDGTVTSVNLTAGDRIDVSGGPITTSGSITVTHGVADGADFITAEAFRDRVIADGGIFEALGEVAIAIGSLEDAASPTSTDYSGGTVLQNLAVDEFGHVLGIGAITLDTDDITEGSTNLYYTDARSRAALSAGTGISYDNSTGIITNSAPDQTVVLTGTGTTTITGTYPSFTINSDDQYDGTVTSVDLTAGTGISVSGGPITSSGSITVTNTAPDQTVVLTASTGISTSGTYPNFTITNSAPDQTVVLTAGTGITTSGTYPNFTVTNSAPDQTVALTAGTGISVTGTYPNFTITNSSPSSGGTVTSIATTAPITGGTITSTGTIGITQSGAAADGYLSSTDWNTFNGKAGSSFTTIAVSGQSDIVADSANDTLTISAGTGITLTTAALTDTLTITNSAPDQVVSLTGAGTTVVTGTYPSFTITSNDQYDGTVTSVAALTLGTTGTDLSSTVANGSTTPVITLNVPTASATNRGALSSTDWTTFNSKQNAITLTTTGNSGAATFVSSTLNIPEYTLTGLGGVPTTRTLSINGTSYDLSANRTWSVGTVTSINLTAGDRIEVSGGPITSSGSITVTHGTATGADFTTAEAFRDRVIADGGIFEALGEVAIAIGSLEDAASPTSTDYSDGFVLQNIAVDEFGHVLGVGATDLDERYAQVVFKNVAVSGQATIVADAIEDTLNIAAGYGVSITTDDTTDTVTIGSQFIPYPVYAASMYQSALTTPFVVTSSWSVVNIDGTNIQLSAPVDSDGVYTENLATVMISIENQKESADFVCVGIRLYNQTQSAIITDSTHTWTGYLNSLGNDSANTIFTYHIPIEEYVATGDTIRVQMIDLNANSPEVNFASFSLLATSGPV
jgi:hypothetical protein